MIVATFDDFAPSTEYPTLATVIPKRLAISVRENPNSRMPNKKIGSCTSIEPKSIAEVLGIGYWVMV